MNTLREYLGTREPHNGYQINLRQDTRTGEYLAVFPKAYVGRHGKYYIAIGEDSCHAEISPEYLTRNTRTVTQFPEWLKRRADSSQGYLLRVVPRLYG